MLAVLDTETSRGGCRVVVEEEEGKIARVPVVGGLPAVVQFVFPRWSSGEDLLPLSGEVRPRPTFFSLSPFSLIFRFASISCHQPHLEPIIMDNRKSNVG